MIQPELKSEQRIFQGGKESGIVIPYNDRESKVESASEALAQGKEPFFRVLWSLLGLWLVYIFENPEEDLLLNIIGGVIVTYCSLMIAVTLNNSLSFARIRKSITKGTAVHRTVLERKLSNMAEILSNGKSVFMLFAMMILTIWTLSVDITDNPVDIKKIVLMVVALLNLIVMVVRITNLAMKPETDIVNRLGQVFSTGTYIWMLMISLTLWLC